jgi:hypothetical protein
MRKTLEAIADDLAEVRSLHLDRVKTLRRELQDAEKDLASVEEKQRAIADAILRAGVFLPMREKDGNAMKFNSVDVKND